MLQNKTIFINKKKYAVGLFWQPLPSGILPKNYAKQLTKSVDKKLNFFVDYRTIIGLGSSKFGHKNNMPVAAIELIKSFKEIYSFLCAFKVKKEFWLVAVRNNIIIYDKLFLSEGDAYDEYLKLKEMPDWGVFFAPSSWKIEGTIEKDLNNSIFTSTKFLLKPISNFYSNLISFILISSFLLGLVYFFRDPIKDSLNNNTNKISKIDPVLAEEYKKQLEEKNKELDKEFEVEKPVKEPIVLPYNSLPVLDGYINSCYKSIAFLMQYVPGWIQTESNCIDNYSSVLFKKKYGNIKDFYEFVSKKFPGSEIEDKSDSEILLKIKIPNIDKVSSKDERDIKIIEREIVGLLQKSFIEGLTTNFTIDSIEDGEDIINLNILEISFSSKLTPMQFIKIFEKFKGVYFTNISWKEESKIWNYEVIIYAK